MSPDSVEYAWLKVGILVRTAGKLIDEARDVLMSFDIHARVNDGGVSARLGWLHSEVLETADGISTEIAERFPERSTT